MLSVEATEDSFVEKRSKFIGRLWRSRPGGSNAKSRDARDGLDATHNCYAYILREGNLMRYSDDGEPARQACPCWTCCGMRAGQRVRVVTRYFGGILLGTGGLVPYPRAHSRSLPRISR
ncbi:MAG: YigZ family protein [Butyricicoccus sp.]